MQLSPLRKNTLLGFLLLNLLHTLAIPTVLQGKIFHDVIEKRCGGCGCTDTTLLKLEQALGQLPNEQIETIEETRKEALKIDDLVLSYNAPIEGCACGSKRQLETGCGCPHDPVSKSAPIKQCSCSSKEPKFSRRSLPKVVGYENGPIGSVEQIGSVEIAHIRKSIDTEEDAASAGNAISNTVQQTAEGQLKVSAHTESRDTHYLHSDNGRIYVEYPKEIQQTIINPIYRRDASASPPLNVYLRHPSMGDWWAIDGPNFLQTYITTYGSSNFTAKHGLFGGLAHCYGLTHGSNYTHNLECVQVRKTLGTENSEHASFALTSLKNFVTLTDLIHDSMDLGFREAAQLIEALPYSRDWWKTYPSANKSQLAVDSIKSSVRDIILSELPWKTNDAWIEETDKIHTEALKSKKGAKLANADPGANSFSVNKWDQLFGTAVNLKDLDEGRGSPGYSPALGQDNADVMAEADRVVDYAQKLRSVIQDDTFSRSGELSWKVFFGLVEVVGEKSKLKPNAVAALETSTVSVGDFMDAIAQLGQHALQETVSEFFNGTHGLDIHELLGFGNLLGTDADKLVAYRDIYPLLLARLIYHKVLNQALLSDQVYITCTVNSAERPHQFGVYSTGSACAKDHSGPQDLKACLEGGDVCYMYRWKIPQRSGMISHNSKPEGICEWGAAPSNINATDIILSSVNGALEGLQDFRLRKDNTPLLSTKPTSIADIADASVPGVFSLPICYSDYSWNTPLHIVRKSRKWYQGACHRDDPYCYEAVPPCYCGPWGSQTKAVWDSIGFIEKSHRRDRGHRETGLCAKLIKKKIKDPLEAYVAYCRLGVRRVFSWTGSRINGMIVAQNGKDKYCDDIIGILERREYGSPEEIEPDVKYAIYCKILGDGRRCKMYKKMWNELTAPETTGAVESLEITEGEKDDMVQYESEFARLVLEEEAKNEGPEE
ncbi:hypothetical protein BDD12DRAFT_906255 [Trichophaea hybrida]|nr:hypothetical protein BDD12DRAFT_906255 [Trichophaea hybrida]